MKHSLFEVYFADGTTARRWALTGDIACAIAQHDRIGSPIALQLDRSYAKLCDNCGSPLCNDGECLLCSSVVDFPAQESIEDADW